jgi:uncharacterized protein
VNPKLALLALVPACAVARALPAPQAGAPLKSIRVTAEGEVSVRPDVAVVLTGVDAEGKDLAAVSDDATAQMRKILSALRAAGIADPDVLTTRHDVQVNRPWQDGRPGPVSGYTVSQEVRVTVRDVSNLGTVLDRVLAAGANALRGLTFAKDDPLPERRAALATAVVAARGKAEAIAKAAGVQLGEVLSVSEGATRPIPLANARVAMAAKEGGAAVSAPGDIEITATVEVVFAIR